MHSKVWQSRFKLYLFSTLQILWSKRSWFVIVPILLCGNLIIHLFTIYCQALWQISIILSLQEPCGMFLLLPYRWGNRGSEMLGNLSNTTQHIPVLGFDPGFWTHTLKIRQDIPLWGVHGQGGRQIQKQKIENPITSVSFHGSKINLFSIQS